jgi:GGDEF domain-containing protein
MNNRRGLRILTLLLGVLWPVAATALLMNTLSVSPVSRVPLALMLLALTGVTTLLWPRRLVGAATAGGAAALFLVADVAQRALDGASLHGADLTALGVVALVLLATPWILRLPAGDMARLSVWLEENEQHIDQLTVRKATGVYRAPHFTSLLEEEIERARRYRRPLTLIVVGIDGWIDLAEDEPEDARRQARLVEEHLIDATRTVDKMVDLGDGQWGVMLPETPLDGATVVAARIGAGLSADIELPGRFGLADFPHGGVTADDLLGEARQALAFARLAGLQMTDRRMLHDAA